MGGNPRSITDILALDFDDVICNSADEAAVTGWRAAGRLWPSRFEGDAPAEIIERFRMVRPVMETGYESILLVRLLRDGLSVDKILDDAASLFTRLINEPSIERDRLIPLFGQTRDAWIAADLSDWIGRHRFYDGVVDALNQSDVPTYIITTKEKRFASALCDAAGLRIPEAHVFGLESGRKSAVLAELSRRHKGARFHFIEDRLATLLQMADCGDLDVRLYFAEWGYNTAEDREQADQAPNIRVLTQDRFPAFVRSF